MIGFLTAALAGILGCLSALLVKKTTTEKFREEHKFLELLLWGFYCGTFFISFPIGFGRLLIKHLKNKKNQ